MADRIGSAAIEIDEGRHLPSGTVTFLFTDVEGSTRLFEQHADAYRSALLRHDAVLRHAVEGHAGQVFETVGDAFYAVFARPQDAVAAAIEAQLALKDEDWGVLGHLQVRMGLHTGEPERRGRHYFGHTLYRCARIMATAHGGQVVLAAATADLVRETLSAGASLRSLGTHRLKDLGEPEHIWQLLHPSLQADFAPLRSLNTLLNNLPQQVTSFVGREHEMSEVRSLLSASRLVTLLGMGGAGKTRLSLQVAADVLDAFSDGVWLVDLAPLRDPALVPQRVAAALGVREDPGRPLMATIEDHLRPKRLLLLLDNCEHLVEACARIADGLLRACPHLRILATSREPLRVSGETVWRVPSLALPDARARLTPEVALASEAVRLFVDRAAAASPGFALDGNSTAVVEICRRVDGIPLAIELSAARVRALSPEQIAARLEQRFALLTGGSRAALPRQRTLRALVDWSYELLQPAERTLFDRLSVFAGGWTLEATEAICGCEGIDASEVLDLLTELVDKSLVVADTATGSAARYQLLETLREYGRERLEEGREAEVVRSRHVAYFRDLAERAEPELTGPRQTEWLVILERAHDDLREALRRSATRGDAETGWRLGGALYRFWMRHGYLSEGRESLDLLLAIPADPELTDAARAARAKALHGAATLAVQQGDHAAARRLFEESLAIKRELGDRSAIAATLNNLGVVARYLGDRDGARPLYEESLALYRELGDRWAMANVLNNLGTMARDIRDTDAARRQLEESLALRRELGDKWGIANALENLGHLALDEGDQAMARAHYTESLALARELGDKRALAFLIEDFGAVAAAAGDPRIGLRLTAAAAALRESIGAPIPPAERERLDRFLGPARGALGAEAVSAAEAEGRALSLDEAIDRALASASSPVPSDAGAGTDRL